MTPPPRATLGTIGPYWTKRNRSDIEEEEILLRYELVGCKAGWLGLSRHDAATAIALYELALNRWATCEEIGKRILELVHSDDFPSSNKNTPTVAQFMEMSEAEQRTFVKKKLSPVRIRMKNQLGLPRSVNPIPSDRNGGYLLAFSSQVLR